MMSEDVVTKYQPEKVLRMLLWLNHGHDGLYGDDGEMQCSRCGLDFKRDTVEAINKAFALRSLGEMHQRAIAQETRGHEAWKEDAKES